MVILVIQIVSRRTFIFIFSSLPGHPEKVNNPTLIWYGLNVSDSLAIKISYMDLCKQLGFADLTQFAKITVIKWH